MQAKSRVYRGHTSAVTSVKVLERDLLVSVSAQDNLVCVWRFKEAEAAVASNEEDNDVFRLEKSPSKLSLV